MIDTSTARYIGPELSDAEIIEQLPADYLAFLRQMNGCVLFGGGLHIRGCVQHPDWHSLQRAWTGQDRLSALYPAVQSDDIPFAQDCFGDQFLLRSNVVFRLRGETGEVESLGIGWTEFLTAAAADPIEFLLLQLLEGFKIEGGTLEPGQLLNVYPPLCTQEANNGVSLKAIPALEQIRFLADFASQIAGVQDGSRIQIVVE